MIPTKIKTFIVTALLFFIASCGGGGSSSENDTPDNSDNATLVINIAGLPSAVNADIVISKGAYSKNVIVSETITALDDGVYTIIANNVSDSNGTYTPDVSSQTVTLSDNQTSTVTVTYILESTPVVLKVISSQGAITGFGSIVVNGIHFLTTDTQVETDDVASTDESALKLGMVVDINGTLDESTGEVSASQISYHAKAEGAIESINLVNQSFVLMQQTVLVTSLTEFEGITFDNLQVGQLVEVSGNINATNEIVATRVEASNEGETERKLRGLVLALDSQNSTFTLNSVTVDYSGAQVEGTLVDGVEVKVSSQQDVVNGSLMVDEVKVLNRHDEGGDDHSDRDEDRGIDGIVTQYVSATEFMVDNQAITTNNDTVYLYGQVTDIAESIHISVYGTLDVNNVLVASTIRFDGEGDNEFHGIVETVNADMRQVTIMGTTIQTDLNTKFKDESSAQVRNFDLSFVNIGDRLDIEAFTSATTTMPIAREVTRERKNNSQGEALRGAVSEINQPEFVVNGVTVKTSSATDFEAGDNQGLTLDQFFSQLTLNVNVKVKGSIDTNGNMLAASVEIKNSEQDDEDNSRTELQGLITTFVSAQDFTVNNHAITTTAQTEYKHGTIANLVVDAAVEIKGEINTDNILVATRVEFDNSDDDDDNDYDNREVEFSGTINGFISIVDFIVGNQSVTTGENTLYEHGSAEQLANGVQVEVEGILLETGVVLAQKIEFKDQDGD
ncbi:MAG: hypothetical protein COB83_00305 [Gammaproteobacteria bacterium]|nr:MAG: hypothetical protein COB83_00305 [Gammaproteobacteria bacterium]